MAIYDFRGTNGSGKSTLMNQLLDLFGGEEVKGVVPGKTKPTVIGYKLKRWKGFVLGRYTPTGGGCDGISPPTEVERRIRYFARQGVDVFLEGILVAHSFKRYNAVAKQMEAKGIPYHFCFLDTPWDVCLKRILARRKLAGNTRPFNPANAQYDHGRIWGTVQRECRFAGRRVSILNHKKPLDQVLAMISNGPLNKETSNGGSKAIAKPVKARSRKTG